MHQAEDLITQIRPVLRAAGDPVRAAAQQAYMKSAMPYWGVTAPQLRTVLRPVLVGYVPAGAAEWRSDVRSVWDAATHREERYAALALARHRIARPWQDVVALDLYHHLVVTGAWWDVVDEIAGHLVGAVLAGHRETATPIMRAWMVDDDLWLRRTVILAQLRHRADTDTTLLHDAIAANAGDTSFWIRKAIGWALREHARTDPAWVRAEVVRLDASPGSGVSPLSLREALKHL